MSTRRLERGLEAVELTLDRMALGGIYDQIGGGFSRYSVDQQWHVPHFEKMLYDNASLSIMYLEAYQYSKKPLEQNSTYSDFFEIHQEVDFSYLHDQKR